MGLDRGEASRHRRGSDQHGRLHLADDLVQADSTIRTIAGEAEHVTIGPCPGPLKITEGAIEALDQKPLTTEAPKSRLCLGPRETLRQHGVAQLLGNADAGRASAEENHPLLV